MSGLQSLLTGDTAERFYRLWKRRRTRLEAWLTASESHLNEPWAYRISWKEGTCTPWVVRSAYHCRWDSPRIIQGNHAGSQLVIEGHFCILVRQNLAIQARCLPLDHALLTSLIDGKILDPAWWRFAARPTDSQMSALLFKVLMYWTLGHRPLFEDYFGEGWARIGAKTEDLQSLDWGAENAQDTYRVLLQSKAPYSLEHRLEERFRGTRFDLAELMVAQEVAKKEQIRPNFLLGELNGLREFSETGVLLNKGQASLKW